MKIWWIAGLATLGMALVLSCNGSKVEVGTDAVDSTSGDTVERVDTDCQLDLELGDSTPGEVDSSDAIDSGSPVPPGCCADDNDCDLGMVCVKTNQPDFGECAAVPVEPYCYFPSDCPVLHGCYDVVYCDCDPFCTPVPGTCGPSNGECCEDDSDCPEGGFCMISTDDPGNTACLALPDPGKCWDDSFCDEGEICEGAKWSGCAYMFVGPLTFGSCTPCMPDCEGKVCGDNGCGGTCGECGPDNLCTPNGLCEVATCDIIVDCILACNEGDSWCADECVDQAPEEIADAWGTFSDCYVWCTNCMDRDCPDDCLLACEDEYLACWPPGDGTCTDLYSCLSACPDGDAGQACANNCFGDASLDALDIWDTFIDCLDQNSYFDCDEQFKCLDDAWDMCLDAFNECLCDPECPETLCEFESCDGIDNDCDGQVDEGCQ